METSLIGIVTSPIGKLAIVDIILAAAIALDDADYDKYKQKNGNRQHHSNEPSGGGYIFLGLNDRPLCNKMFI